VQQGPICEVNVSNCTRIIIVVIIVVVGGKLFKPKPMEVEFFVLSVAINFKAEHDGLMCTLNPICLVGICQAIYLVWKLKMKRSLIIVLIGGEESNFIS
jgi:hypothetical protein